MEDYEIALVVAAVVLILLAVAYLIKRRCFTSCSGGGGLQSQHDRYLDPSSTPSFQRRGPTSFIPSSNRQSRQEYFDGTFGGARVNNTFVTDHNSFHVENESHWPPPYYTIRSANDSWTPSRPQPNTSRVNSISGHRRQVGNVNNTHFQLPSEHVAGRSGGERKPSYAAAAGATRKSVGSERRRPRPYDTDGPVPASSHSQQRKALPVLVHQDGESRRSKKKEREFVVPAPASKLKKLNDDDTDINNLILAMQGNLREDDTPNETIVEVQKLIMLTTDRRLLSEDCRLIIGVDATPATQAGYCVNLKEKCLSYYVVKRNDLPWVLHDPNDPSEFEMKNFMFALTVWEDVILKNKRIRIYTDNFAITKADCFDGNGYGERAFEVLHHLRNCKGVNVLNFNNMAVNRFKNLKQFAKFIQPADDLSRWHIGNAVDFLTKMYEIDQENVHGTHALDLNHRRLANGKTWYKPTERYQQILSFAKGKINCHDCPNASCSGTDLLQASLRRKK